MKKFKMISIYPIGMTDEFKIYIQKKKKLLVIMVILFVLLCNIVLNIVQHYIQKHIKGKGKITFFGESKV